MIAVSCQASVSCTSIELERSAQRTRSFALCNNSCLSFSPGTSKLVVIQHLPHAVPFLYARNQAMHYYLVECGPDDFCHSLAGVYQLKETSLWLQISISHICLKVIYTSSPNPSFIVRSCCCCCCCTERIALRGIFYKTQNIWKQLEHW